MKTQNYVRLVATGEPSEGGMTWNLKSEEGETPTYEDLIDLVGAILALLSHVNLGDRSFAAIIAACLGAFAATRSLDEGDPFERVHEA